MITCVAVLGKDHEPLYIETFGTTSPAIQLHHQFLVRLHTRSRLDSHSLLARPLWTREMLMHTLFASALGPCESRRA